MIHRRLRARIERAVKRIVGRFPAAEKVLRPKYKAVVYRVRRLKLKLRLVVQGYNVPLPNRIHWIDPKLIQYHTNYNGNKRIPIDGRVFDSIRDEGRIYAGDWDLPKHKFFELLVYKAFDARMNHGLPWENTPFYEQTISSIEAGEVLWGCGTRGEADQRFRYLDNLIQSIKEKGYQLSEDEVQINLGRNGEYLFQNGRHRLSIAKVLGLPKIPVQIFVRHELWQRFREHLISIANMSEGERALCQPLMHPDLSDIPIVPGCEERWLRIKNCLTPSSGAVLDVGAKFGYYCHKLEDLGFDCYAVEHDRDIARAADIIRVSQRKSFSISVGDVIDPAIAEKLRDIRFEIVFAVNELHRFLRTEATFNALKTWLKTLNTRQIYFEPLQHSERQTEDSFVNFQEREFVEFVLSHTSLRNARPIFESHDGRRTYLLS